MQWLAILLSRKNILPGGLVALLRFYWIDLTYMNRMPLTACQIWFWLNFYDCLKIINFGTRTKSFFSQHLQLGTIHYRSILPISMKFGMRIYQ